MENRNGGADAGIANADNYCRPNSEPSGAANALARKVNFFDNF